MPHCFYNMLSPRLLQTFEKGRYNRVRRNSADCVLGFSLVCAAHKCEGDSTRRVDVMECRAGSEGRHAAKQRDLDVMLPPRREGGGDGGTTTFANL